MLKEVEDKLGYLNSQNSCFSEGNDSIQNFIFIEKNLRESIEKPISYSLKYCMPSICKSYILLAKNVLEDIYYFGAK